MSGCEEMLYYAITHAFVNILVNSLYDQAFMNFLFYAPDQMIGGILFLAPLHFSAEELMLYPRRQRRRQRPRPHAKC